MGIFTFFYLIYDILIWGSAAILVGSISFIYYILKFFIKMIGKISGSSNNNEEINKTRNFKNVKENARVR
jgi:hypothetical protein